MCYTETEAMQKQVPKNIIFRKMQKVVLFAPTFRERVQKDGKRFVFSEIWTIDFQRLLDNLQKKFGGKWYLCVRVHPQLAPTFQEYKNPGDTG